MIQPIVQYPDPVLSTVCEDADPESAETATLIHDLFDTVDESREPGKRTSVGLAANQIGVCKRVAVISWKDWRFALVNPKLLKVSTFGTWMDEGCMSLPNDRVEKIWRPDKIQIAEIYVHHPRDIGKFFKKSYVKTTHEFVARIVQHELDHLNGIGILERRVMCLPMLERKSSAATV